MVPPDARTMTPPTLDDIRARDGATCTPRWRRRRCCAHPLLAETLGADVHVKHENHNPTGAFKVRGGLNLIARLSDVDRARGVISATTGNHGQSIAFAAARAGVPCTLVVPVGNNPSKNALMRAWGADGHRARQGLRRGARAGGAVVRRAWPALRALRQRARPHQRRRHVRPRDLRRRSPASTSSLCRSAAAAAPAASSPCATRWA